MHSNFGTTFGIKTITQDIKIIHYEKNYPFCSYLFYHIVHRV